MRALVTGATGYVGAAVAAALLRSGRKVRGTVRTAAAAERLPPGVEPVVADMSRPGELAAGVAAEDGPVAHCAFDPGDADGRLERAAVGELLTTLERSGRALVVSSGVWVLGDTGGRMADEDAPTDPPEVYAWRPALERAVLSAAGRGVRPTVIRPAMVFGHGGGPLRQFADMAGPDGVARHVGDGTNHWTLVHVDDLADLYVRVLADAPPGTLWHGAAGDPARVADIARAATGGPVRAWPQAEAAAVIGESVADALVRDQRMSGERGRRLLGWRPAGGDVLAAVAAAFAPARATGGPPEAGGAPPPGSDPASAADTRS